MKKVKEFLLNPAKLFIPMALIMGIMFSLMMPFTRVPDEGNHVLYMMQGFSLSDETVAIYMDKYYRAANDAVITMFDDINRDRSLEDTTNLDLDKYLSVGLSDNDSSIKFKSIPHSKLVFAYFSPFVGFLIGALLKLPILAIVQLAELTALLFYILFGYLAIKIAPYGKFIFLFLLTTPMCMHLASSFNYDSILISVSALLFAYVLRLKAENTKVGWKQFLLIVFMSFILFSVKLPYALLGSVIFIIPLENISLPVKIGKNPIYLEKIFKKTRFVLIPLLIIVAIPLLAKIDPENGGTLLASLSLPRRSVKIILNSFVVPGVGHWKALINGIVGAYGFFDTGVTLKFSALYIVVFILVFFYKDKDEMKNNNNLLSRGWLILYSAIIMYMVYVSQFIWTFKMNGWSLENPTLELLRQYILSIEVYIGMQGRYYIPVILPVLTAIYFNKGYQKKYIVSALCIGFYVISLVYNFNILYYHYWN